MKTLMSLFFFLMFIFYFEILYWERVNYGFSWTRPHPSYAYLQLQTTEPFGKELVMTSDEASMKNSMLPKGYAYVPADCLSNDKQSNEDIYASGPGEPDG